MSLKTWKEEFYPTRAIEHRMPGQGDDPDMRPTREQALAALDHSILKWSGLTPENLARHEVQVIGTAAGCNLYDSATVSASMWVNSETCALCVLFLDNHREEGETAVGADESRCGGCPLVAARGGFACDESPHGMAPYMQFASLAGRDPQPMLDLLKLARTKLTQE